MLSIFVASATSSAVVLLISETLPPAPDRVFRGRVDEEPPRVERPKDATAGRVARELLNADELDEEARVANKAVKATCRKRGVGAAEARRGITDKSKDMNVSTQEICVVELCRRLLEKKDGAPTLIVLLLFNRQVRWCCATQ